MSWHGLSRPEAAMLCISPENVVSVVISAVWIPALPFADRQMPFNTHLLSHWATVGSFCSSLRYNRVNGAVLSTLSLSCSSDISGLIRPRSTSLCLEHESVRSHPCRVKPGRACLYQKTKFDNVAAQDMAGCLLRLKPLQASTRPSAAKPRE
jgi:hypothetical protein